MSRLRIATFNLETLDDRPDANPSFAERVAVLRPLLERIDADVLCLQEVNAQEVAKREPRRFAALEALLETTPYAAYHRAGSSSPGGGPADVHNLVTLSRWPIAEQRQIRNELVRAPLYRLVTAIPAAEDVTEVTWDRPLLYTAVSLPNGRRLHVLNLHLRAPLAAFVPGQKLAPFVWKTTGGWAEGFYLATMKRTGQALEARLFVDRLFDADPDALVAVAGDLNAEARETPVRAIYGDPEDTGNEVLAERALSPIEVAVPAERRFSVLHHGLKLMLDHLMVSPRLKRAHRAIDILNEALPDEYLAWIKGVQIAGSFHAPVIAEFELPD
jgi:endonuclease/exonuclease/phosphatase family metal-dependent hydrolase